MADNTIDVNEKRGSIDPDLFQAQGGLSVFAETGNSAPIGNPEGETEDLTNNGVTASAKMYFAFPGSDTGVETSFKHKVNDDSSYTDTILFKPVFTIPHFGQLKLGGGFSKPGQDCDSSTEECPDSTFYPILSASTSFSWDVRNPGYFTPSLDLSYSMTAEKWQSVVEHALSVSSNFYTRPRWFVSAEVTGSVTPGDTSFFDTPENNVETATGSMSVALNPWSKNPVLATKPLIKASLGGTYNYDRATDEFSGEEQGLNASLAVGWPSRRETLNFSDATDFSKLPFFASLSWARGASAFYGEEMIGGPNLGYQAAPGCSAGGYLQTPGEWECVPATGGKNSPRWTETGTNNIDLYGQYNMRIGQFVRSLKDIPVISDMGIQVYGGLGTTIGKTENKITDDHTKDARWLVGGSTGVYF